MRPLRWTSSRSVFLPQIDAEHRSLVTVSQTSCRAPSALAHAPEERVREAIRHFADLEEHFAHEERLMRSTGYENLRLAQTAARRRSPQNRERREGVRKRRSQSPRRIDQVSLDGWFRDHTALADRMMSTYLRNYERRAAVS